LLGTLGGNERVIPLAFHVDYFNDPWKDPFSDPAYSRREAQYSLIYNRQRKLNKPDYLYFTPMVMVDGRTPLLGSGGEAPGKARAAIRQALRDAPDVALAVAWREGGGPRRKDADITVRPRTARAEGREVLVGVATYEDRIATNVESGELRGKTYVGRYVVRRFEIRTATATRSRPAELGVPVELGEGWDAKRCGVVVFAQDEATGRIFQAARLPWDEAPAVGEAAGAETPQSGGRQ
jgi:hypothetical protein